MKLVLLFACVFSVTVTAEAFCEPGFTWSGGGYCKGNDIEVLIGVNISVCHRTCVNTCGCQAFVHRAENSTCWLKETCLRNDPTVFVKAEGYRYARWTWDRYTIKHGFDCPGNDFDYIKGFAKPYDCEVECRKRCLCKAAVYNDITKECFLKKKCDPVGAADSIEVHLKPDCSPEQCSGDCGKKGTDPPPFGACLTQHWSGKCFSIKRCEKKESRVSCPQMRCGRGQFCCFPNNRKPPANICLLQ